MTSSTHLTAAQVRHIQATKSMTNIEFADEIGCDRSQVVIYRREGLPNKMGKGVRRHLLRLAAETGALTV